MSELSQKLEVADLYIQAINSLSKVCLNENSGIYSSYTVRFLVENKSKISECFGAETYRPLAAQIHEYPGLRDRRLPEEALCLLNSKRLQHERRGTYCQVSHV